MKEILGLGGNGIVVKNKESQNNTTPKKDKNNTITNNTKTNTSNSTNNSWDDIHNNAIPWNIVD